MKICKSVLGAAMITLRRLTSALFIQTSARRLFRCCVIVSILILTISGGIVAANEGAPYSENFESYQAGTFTTDEKENGWGQWIQQATSNVTLDVAQENGNKYLKWNKKAKGQATVYRLITDEVSSFDKYNMSFRFKADFAGSSILTEIGVSCEIAYDNASKKYTMAIWNGSANEKVENLLLDLSDWNTIKFAVDSKEETVSIYLNNKLLKKNLKRKTTGSVCYLTRFQLRMNNGCIGRVDLDDFLVEEVVAEPFVYDFENLQTDNSASLIAGNDGTTVTASNMTGAGFEAARGKFGKGEEDTSVYLHSDSPGSGAYISMQNSSWSVKDGQCFAYSMNTAFEKAGDIPITIGNGAGDFIEIYPERICVFGRSVYLSNALQAGKWYNIMLICASGGDFRLYVDSRQEAVDSIDTPLDLSELRLNAPVSVGGVYFDDIKYAVYNRIPAANTAEIAATDSRLAKYQSGLNFYGADKFTVDSFKEQLQSVNITDIVFHSADGKAASGAEPAASKYFEAKTSDGTVLYGRISGNISVYKNSGLSDTAISTENGSSITAVGGLGEKENGDTALVVTGCAAETLRIVSPMTVGGPAVYEISVLMNGAVKGELTLAAFAGGVQRLQPVVWLENGVIYTKNQAGTRVRVGSYRDNQWAHFAVLATSGRRNANIYLNGKPIMLDAQIFDGIPSGFSALQFAVDASAAMDDKTYAAVDNISIINGVYDGTGIEIQSVADEVAVDHANSVIAYPFEAELSDCITIGADVRVIRVDSEYLVLNRNEIYAYYMLVDSDKSESGISITRSGNILTAKAYPVVAGGVMIIAAYDVNGVMIKTVMGSDVAEIEVTDKFYTVKGIYVDGMSGMHPLCDAGTYRIQ